MAQQATLQVTARQATGKGAARSLRRDGKVPGVIYGHNRAPEPLVLEAVSLGKLLGSISAASTLVDVSIDGGAPVKALIREIQRNPVKPSDLLHVDLYEVRADETITAEVPIHLVGVADGVRNFGGVLEQVLHTIEIECLPANLVDRIDLDVSALGIGDVLFVRDITVANAEVLNDGDQPVCTVVAPRVEEAPAAAPTEAPSGEPELIRKPKPEEEAGESK
ncbi:MAG TPA: 50S ribosomal protein L25 [Gemmatimonadales bacterium]|jgi:large subunit ribosomal protein L25|nr:50S ribosomal protein L25 [Gemmatimonadales bacterium]